MATQELVAYLSLVTSLTALAGVVYTLGQWKGAVETKLGLLWSLHVEDAMTRSKAIIRRSEPILAPQVLRDIQPHIDPEFKKRIDAFADGYKGPEDVIKVYQALLATVGIDAIVKRMNAYNAASGEGLVLSEMVARIVAYVFGYRRDMYRDI